MGRVHTTGVHGTMSGVPYLLVVLGVGTLPGSTSSAHGTHGTMGRVHLLAVLVVLG